MVLGTPAYMAAEQFEGNAADARSDQFSFAVSRYEALFGQAPFGDANYVDWAHEVCAGNIRPPPTVRGPPALIRRAILRALRSRPDVRLPDMDALPVELWRDPARRWRTVAASTVAVAVALLACVPLFPSSVGCSVSGVAWPNPTRTLRGCGARPG